MASATDRLAPVRHLGGALRYVILAMVLVVPSFLGAGMAYFVMVVSLAFLVACAIRKPTRLRPEGAGTLFLLAYGLYFVATCVVAIANDRLGELAFALNLIALALFVPLHSLMAGGARPGNALLLANLALVGSIFCLVLASLEVGLLEVERAGVSTGDVIRFGATALILGFLALIGLRETRSAWRWLYLLGPAAGLLTVVLSGSRGPLVAVPFMAAAAALLLMPSRRHAVIAILGAIAAFAALLLSAETLGLERLGSLLEIGREILQGERPADAATGIRMSIYRAGIAAFLESPWIGYGWSQITIAPQPWFDDPVPLKAYSHLHNDLLNFLVAIGVTGAVCYGLTIAAPLAGAAAGPNDGQRRARLYGVTVLCLAYFIGGQSSLMFGFEYQTVLYVAIAAILLGFCRDGAPDRSP